MVKNKNNNNSSNSLVFGLWPQTKTVMMHLLEGPVYGHITKDRRRKKSQDPAGIEHTTSVTRCALTHCSATAAQKQSTRSYLGAQLWRGQEL